MAKRTRLSSSFNPVYPYEDENSSHPFINPGFISPNGFTQSPDGVLTLNCVAPLTTANGALDIKVGGGLKVNSTDGFLEENINITSPLTKSNHSIGLEWSDGLQTNEAKLCVKLGKGLVFDSSSAIAMENNTLWTGAKPSANCVIKEGEDSPDCKLTLVLVKNGGLVNGYITLMGDSEYTNTLFKNKQVTIDVNLAFDNTGQIITYLSSLKSNLNFKDNQNMATGTITSAKGFMPSTTAYPFITYATQSLNEDYIYGECYYKSTNGTLFPLKVTVTLNRRMSASGMAYAMNFSWSLNAEEAPETTEVTLITSPFFFSYIREDD
ncbi:fiber [simian adenovirus 21]|uniref:fiber n=1 Tax=simian adenovirus 21 TaxID=198503 RepID=UPI0000162139|nr:fiber [Simian adenovirus 21]